MKYLNIIDTNVLVSSLISKDSESPIYKLLDYVTQKKIIPVYSDDIYEEYKEVLNRKEFDFLPYEIGKILNLIKENGIKIKPTECEEKLIDYNDQMFYDALMSKKDDNTYLVTGNLKHFPISEYIVNAKQMIEIIMSNKRLLI